MGTARSIENWSWDQGSPCECGLRDCALVGRAAHERRLAVIRAQEFAFDEPHRMTSPENPLARDSDLTADSSAA